MFIYQWVALCFKGNLPFIETITCLDDLGNLFCALFSAGMECNVNLRRSLRRDQGTHTLNVLGIYLYWLSKRSKLNRVSAMSTLIRSGDDESVGFRLKYYLTHILISKFVTPNWKRTLRRMKFISFSNFALLVSVHSFCICLFSDQCDIRKQLAL